MSTVGYIVECYKHGAMWYDQWPPKGEKQSLYFANRVTVFPTRRAARTAIKNTIADRPAFETEFGKLSVTRLEGMD